MVLYCNIYEKVRKNNYYLLKLHIYWDSSYQWYFGIRGCILYDCIYNVFNILFWTHGVWVMSGDGKMKGIWKNLLTPAILAVAIGLCFFIFQIHLPSIVSEPVQMIASMNTPLAMIIAGANLAQGNILESFKNIRLYFVSF